ncbi:MAG: hypothetical protein HKO58_01505 [Gammaproteobacteria bacterium]|nr:hypothetical protein [Gammaproteobacteria bacterium]
MRNLSIGLVIGILLTLFATEFYTPANPETQPGISELAEVSTEVSSEDLSNNELTLIKESNAKLSEQVVLLKEENSTLAKELNELQSKGSTQQKEASLEQESIVNNEMQYSADSIQMPEHVIKQWNKMDEFNNPDFVPQKDDWSMEAEIYLNSYLLNNSLSNMSNPTVLCDTEACQISAIEFNVEKNIRNTPGGEEWTGLWQSLSQTPKALEYFNQEKIGSSHRDDESQTKKHIMVIFKKRSSQDENIERNSG